MGGLRAFAVATSMVAVLFGGGSAVQAADATAAARSTTHVPAKADTFGTLSSPGRAGRSGTTRRETEPKVAASDSAAGPTPQIIVTPCFGANPSATNQIYVERYSSYVGATYFDAVQGEATARDLDVCVGGGGRNTTSGYSAVVMTNIQSDATQTIYQIGMIKTAGMNEVDFTYVNGDAVGLWAFYSDGTRVKAIDGTVYRSFIFRETNGHVTFQIDKKIASGVYQNIWRKETSTAWPSNLNHAWWGYETLDDVSNHGHASGVGNINLTQMGYSIPGNSGFWFRQPTSSAIICTGTGCNSNRIKTILSTYYSSDTLDVKTT